LMSGLTAHEALTRYRCEPLEFIRRLWPGIKVWRKQREIAESVARNYGTIVHSAIETGKGWIAARLIIWFYATRFPCKVIGTSITQPQLRDSLWGEIDAALREPVAGGEVIARADGDPMTVRELLGIDVVHMELRRLDEHGRPHANDWVRLRVAKDVEGMHGIHLGPLPDGGPTVLAVLDETSGVSDKFCEGLEGQAHRMLILGNPLHLAGYFARKIRAGDEPDRLCSDRLRWKVIHIDGARTPNVSSCRTRLSSRMRTSGMLTTAGRGCVGCCPRVTRPACGCRRRGYARGSSCGMRSTMSGGRRTCRAGWAWTHRTAGGTWSAGWWSTLGGSSRCG